MKVAEIIQDRKEVFSIASDTTVHDAARYLREKGVRAVGVRDAGGKLVGVVSQSDISDKVAAENKPPAWMRVSEIMSTNLITVPPDTSLDECMVLMEKNSIFHLLVVDEKGNYRGMISVTDLLKLMVTDHKARADLLESYIYPQR